MSDAAEHPGEISSPLPCIDADGRVAAWVCCQNCRYNLFGLDAHGNCPECGTAISLSTVVSQLRSMPVARLRAVRNVAGIVRLAIGAFFLAIIVGIGAIFANAAAGIAIVLFVLSVLAVGAAGFAAVHADDGACTRRTRDCRADFTDSLIIAPFLIPFLASIAGMLVPSIARLAAPTASDSHWLLLPISLLAAVIVSFLLWLTILVLMRPITTLTRFLAELFAHAWPMNPDRAGSVLVMAKTAHWLIFVAIPLGFASIFFDANSISRGTAELARLAGILGMLAFIGSLARLFWLLGDVWSALTGPILEARLRERDDEPA